MSGTFALDGVRVAIVGAGGGIGAASARLAAECGAQVIAVDRAAPETLAAEIGGEACACDVTDPAAVAALAGAVGDIDGLVYAAGVQPYGAWPGEDWRTSWAKVLNVNALGAALVTEALFPALSQTSGRIVLVGSQAAQNGGPFSAPHYVFSKGGLHSYCRWLARRAAPEGVLVNAVAPGPVATAMIEPLGIDAGTLPLNRICSPEEVAGPIVFLLSPAASYVSGIVLDVNGAMSFN